MTTESKTIAFYDNNAEDFVKGTVGVDMSALYARFLAHIPAGGSILDAGCGAGRDSLYFTKRGYKVIAFDGSLEMAKRSSSLTGLKVLHQAFGELVFNEEFDGVWACASVLHVSKSEIESVLAKLARATKHKGVLYLSFKHGTGEEARNGRLFNNYTRESFLKLLERCPFLSELEMWTTGDARPGREHEIWLNVLLMNESPPVS